jgi:phosphoserine phosphatase
MGDVLTKVDELLARIPAQIPADTQAVAVFDADGTLWRGDIGDEAFIGACEAGLVDDATYEGPLQEWARKWPVTLPKDKAAGVARIFDESKELHDFARRVAFYEMQAWIYAGHTRAEIAAYGERLFAGGFEKDIYADMRALVAKLQERKVRCVIVSASHGALVQAGAARLGIAPTDAFGMEPHVDDSGRCLPTIARSTFGPGKVAALKKVLPDLEKHAPFIGAGDSVLGGDRELLAWARVAIAIAPRSAHRQAAQADARVLIFDPAA